MSREISEISNAAHIFFVIIYSVIHQPTLIS